MISVVDQDGVQRWSADQLRARYGDGLVTGQCAEAAGVRPKTWTYYVARGYAPEPDRRYGRTPVWSPEQASGGTATARSETSRC